MAVTIYKNFFSQEECSALNALANEYLDKKVLRVHGIPGRATANYTKWEPTFEYPEFIYKLSDRVREATDTVGCVPDPDRGAKGINVAVTFKQGNIKLHRDPRGHNDGFIYRCNAITQKSESGGDVYVAGKKVEVEIGDLHCYAASEIPHLVTAIDGNTPRILWMFSMEVPMSRISSFI